jgi:hypothetical protein
MCTASKQRAGRQHIQVGSLDHKNSGRMMLFIEQVNTLLPAEEED